MDLVHGGYKNEKLLNCIGFIVKQNRKMSGLTQESLAKNALISTNYLREIEKGKKSVSVEIIYRICTVLGLGITDFFKAVEQLMSSDEKIIFL